MRDDILARDNIFVRGNIMDVTHLGARQCLGARRHHGARLGASIIWVRGSIVEATSWCEPFPGLFFFRGEGLEFQFVPVRFGGRPMLATAAL